MIYKYQYNNDSEREAFFSAHKDKHLLEEQNITEGNFLVFTDELPEPTLYDNLSKDVSDLKDESFNNMIAIAEVFEGSMKNESENLDTMIAVSEVYEIIIDLQRQIDKLQPEIGAS